MWFAQVVPEQEHIYYVVHIYNFKGISDKKFASLASNALKRSWLRGLDIFTSMMEVHSSVTSKSPAHIISWLQNWWQSSVFFISSIQCWIFYLDTILIFLFHTNMVSYIASIAYNSAIISEFFKSISSSAIYIPFIW